MVEKWILLRNRWRHEAFVLVQPNPVVAMKQHVTNGKGDRFIYWDHCPLLAEIGHRTPTPQAISRPTNPDRAYRLSRRSYQENPHALGHAT
ncbi:hypothetical protein ACSS6O_004924 [Pseudomonas aeruginosa]